MKIGIVVDGCFEIQRAILETGDGRDHEVPDVKSNLATTMFVAVVSQVHIATIAQVLRVTENDVNPSAAVIRMMAYELVEGVTFIARVNGRVIGLRINNCPQTRIIVLIEKQQVTVRSGECNLTGSTVVIAIARTVVIAAVRASQY
jgi:hypothetical protein